MYEHQKVWFLGLKRCTLETREQFLCFSAVTHPPMQRIPWREWCSDGFPSVCVPQGSIPQNCCLLLFLLPLLLLLIIMVTALKKSQQRFRKVNSVWSECFRTEMMRLSLEQSLLVTLMKDTRGGSRLVGESLWSGVSLTPKKRGKAGFWGVKALDHSAYLTLTRSNRARIVHWRHRMLNGHGQALGPLPHSVSGWELPGTART